MKKASIRDRISFKILDIRIRIHTKRIIKHSFKEIKHVYKAILYIGIPRSEKENNLLESAIELYDNCIVRLNDYVIGHARDYIQKKENDTKDVGE